MYIKETEVYSKETKNFKFSCNGYIAERNNFFVGIFSFDIDGFYWHKLYIYINGKKRIPTHFETMIIESAVEYKFNNLYEEW